MAQEPAHEVPDGSAVFPLIPAELGIHPLLLAVLQATVFFDGSSADVVHPAAADEAMNYIVTYLARLQGSELQRVREDIECLLEFARHNRWPKEEVEFLQSFLADYGIGSQDHA